MVWFEMRMGAKGAREREREEESPYIEEVRFHGPLWGGLGRGFKKAQLGGELSSKLGLEFAPKGFGHPSLSQAPDLPAELELLGLKFFTPPHPIPTQFQNPTPKKNHPLTIFF